LKLRYVGTRKKYQLELNLNISCIIYKELYKHIQENSIKIP